MSNIRTYYQPLYNAIQEYKKVHEKWDDLNGVFEYLNDKADKKKEKKNKNFKNYLRKAKKKRRKAWKKVFMRSLMYFGIWFMVLLLFVGLLSAVTPLMLGTSFVLAIGAAFFYNKDALPRALEKEKELDMLLKYQEGREKEKNIDETLDALRWELFQLRQKEHSLEEYIKEGMQKLMTENTVLAKEILDSHGIDAEIEMKPIFKQLSYHKDKEGR